MYFRAIFHLYIYRSMITHLPCLIEPSYIYALFFHDDRVRRLYSRLLLCLLHSRKLVPLLLCLPVRSSLSTAVVL